MLQSWNTPSSSQSCSLAIAKVFGPSLNIDRFNHFENISKVRRVSLEEGSTSETRRIRDNFQEFLLEPVPAGAALAQLFALVDHL